MIPPESNEMDESQPESRIRTLCDEAREQMCTGLFDDALATVSNAVRLDPDCIAAYEIRAAIETMQHHWTEAIAALTELLRLQPTDVLAFTRRATAYNSTGQYERAILDCNSAIQLDPMCAGAYSDRAHALFRLGREEQSDADAKRGFLLQASPENIEESDRRDLIVSLLDNAGRLAEAGHHAEAIEAYSAVLLHEPEHVEARYHRGVVYYQTGQFEKAGTDLMEAWRLKQERDRVARGYLVSVEGEQREKIWGVFPDNYSGKRAAQSLAGELATNPKLTAGVQGKIGGLTRAIIYEFEEIAIEIIDYIWTDEVLARPKKIGRVSLSDNENAGDGIEG